MNPLSLSLSLSLVCLLVSAYEHSLVVKDVRSAFKLLNLVYDEDFRLVVRYLMKRDLRRTKYWHKSIGVFKVDRKLRFSMTRAPGRFALACDVRIVCFPTKPKSRVRSFC